MVTRREVARRAGVSEGTVSNVINGKDCVKADKRERVLQIIRELKYVPNQTARNLVTSRSSHIGIAIYETTNPYHMELARSIEETAIKRGYIVSLFMLDNNMPDKLRAISERRLDGLVNFMTNQYPEEFIDGLREQGTMLSNFDSDVGSSFANDYAEATKSLMEKLYEMGHRNVAYLSNFDEKGFAADSRGIQFLKSAAELAFNRTEVYYNHEFNASSDCIGRNLAEKLLEDFEEVTAVFCTNDLSALGCMRTLADAGKFVPDDISVIGCDDINLASIMYPSLTTIAIDKARQGADIANNIIDRIENDGEVLHKNYVAKAVIRESIAPPRRMK